MLLPWASREAGWGLPSVALLLWLRGWRHGSASGLQRWRWAFLARSCVGWAAMVRDGLRRFVNPMNVGDGELSGVLGHVAWTRTIDKSGDSLLGWL